MARRAPILGIALAATLILPMTVGPSAATPDEVVILSRYRSYVGANMLPRKNGHPGVDFGERLGAPVLAAADGIVAGVINSPAGCGHGVVIEHPPFERWTTYCHMHLVSVEAGQAVRRGETIGQVGRSGSTSDVPHVHLELCTFPCTSHADGDFFGTEDPFSIAEGCYEADRVYPSDRLVVTFPVSCLHWVRWR